MKDKIIDFIQKNRVSSTEVADALGKKGAIKGVKAINSKKFVVGNVFWGYAYGGSNWGVHKQLENVQENDLVFIETFDCDNKAVFGDLVSKFLLLYKQASGIVTTGNLRDAHRLIKENWPIWCSGYNPIGCANKKLEDDLDEDIIKQRKKYYEGSIAVCDDTGVTIIPKDKHNEDFLFKLKEIEEQEDIWYECIDRKGWSTYETVCLKKYKD